MNKTTFVYLGLLTISLVPIAYCNQCLCENIISQSVCQDPNTYAGICDWRNGQCYERNCQQRNSLNQCEPEYGYYYCGWMNGTKCVNPDQCSDIAVRKWCQNAGCVWVPGSNNDTNLYSINGNCVGELSGIQCENLDKASCQNVGYIFDIYTYTYNLCYLNQMGQCSSYKSCSLLASEYECSTPNCKWNKESQQCYVKQCGDMKSQSDCLLIGGDDQTPFLCQWDATTAVCRTTQCSAIEEKSRCNHQTQGYGKFCYWSDASKSCSAYSCTEQTDMHACMHQTLMEGGVSTCTWITNPNNNQGQCYGCDNGPTYLAISSFGVMYPLAISLILALI